MDEFGWIYIYNEWTKLMHCKLRMEEFKSYYANLNNKWTIQWILYKAWSPTLIRVLINITKILYIVNKVQN